MGYLEARATGTGATTTHTYSTPGSYIVPLTVTDAAGHSDADALTVTVESEFPSQTWALLILGVVAFVVIAVVYRRILAKPELPHD